LKDVTVICLSLFADGLSTTTPTVLFNLYALATNQEVQSKVHDEISAVMKGVAANDDINQEHINQMPYLKAFVRETFRLWPNGTEVSRYTETDMVLSGYQVPAGTHVDLNPLVHFRDGKLFPDPHVYRPERWLRKGEEEDGENNSVHPYLLTPFGHGTRMCAGRRQVQFFSGIYVRAFFIVYLFRFAEQDLYVLLATILRKYKLEYPVGEGMAQIYNTLLFPDRPVRVKFVSRK
jgi:cytochrome P450